MARKGRPPTGIPHRAKELWLPEQLLLEVEMYLPRDTLTGKIQHGAWSDYVARLLREDLASKARGKATFPKE